MTPAVRVSALGIRFTKKELKELKRVWKDESWDEENIHENGED
jgi:hypothetical protein